MENKVKVSMSAVIPTAQYANLQPTVEVEASTFEEARDMALEQIQGISAMVSESPLKVDFNKGVTNLAAAAVQLVPKLCYATGAEVLMDEVKHTYHDTDGNRYLSGSGFAHKYVAQFPAETVSLAMAAKAGVEQQDILKMWATNAEASTSLGTAIHAALELYGRFRNTSHAVKGTYESCTHKNPILKHIVESFYEGREDEQAEYEAFVVDKEKKLCGFIDRLLIVDADNKVVRVQDYKTNPDINKKKSILDPFKGVVPNTELGAYWLQLSFYAYILTRAGYTVEGLDIFNYDGEKWVTYTSDVINISNAL